MPKVGLEWIIGLDKWAHVFVYAILVWLLAHSLAEKRRLKRQNYLIIVGIGIGYGSVIEMVQHYFLSDRFFEIPDLIANIIGSILGAVIFRFFIKKEIL